MKTAEEWSDDVVKLWSKFDWDEINFNQFKNYVKNYIEQAQKEAYHEGQSSPKIKQLEWDFYGTYYTTSRMEYRIETPFFHCMITQGGDFNIYEDECLLWIDGVSYNFRTLDEAKAAAQAEFEKRVIECLDL